jgi:hypothetical protein
MNEDSLVVLYFNDCLIVILRLEIPSSSSDATLSFDFVF